MNEAIQNLLAKFANSFDLKDWSGLRETLAEAIECDYQDLREKQKTYSKADFVKLREESLRHLKTQHLLTNLETKIVGKEAISQLSAVIFRQDKDGSQFNSHAIYRFHLNLENDEWKITKIKQSILWNEGDSSIHPGVNS